MRCTPRVVSHDSNPNGSAITVVDIKRIKDGMFEERWDVIQPEATKEESKSTSHVGDVFTR
jgi:predicted SnoaL-like aldol condensation-catalyzing enzyme